jgi:hypothetical protein
MASTYSTNLKIELMGAGDQTGTWGDTTNGNLGTVIEQAIVGNASITFLTDANASLPIISDGPSASPSRAVFQQIQSSVSLGATRTLTVPSIQKNYVFYNATTGGRSITIANSVAATPSVTIANGQVASVYVDGANGVYPYTNSLVSGSTINGLVIADVSSTQTLSNKTLTTPVLTNPNSSTGTFASPTISGTATSTAIISGNKSYRNNVNAIGTVTTTLAIDCALGDIVTATLGGNPTISFSNAPTSGDATALTLMLTQDATGSRTLTWPSSVYCEGGTRATNLRPVTTANSVTLYSLFTRDGGTIWYAARLNSSAYANT